MQRNGKYRTLFVDTKLSDLNVSSLVSPAQSIYLKMRSPKTKCCDLLWSLERRLTQQITGIRILITYHHREIKGIWHDPKYRLLLWLSRDQLKAGYRLGPRRWRNRWSPSPTPSSYLNRWGPSEGSRKISFADGACTSSYRMYVSLKTCA